MTLERAMLHYNHLKFSPFNNLNHCYNRASRLKEEIFNDCYISAIERGCSCWGITTYNAQKFTFCTIKKMSWGEDLLTIDTGYGGTEVFFIDPQTKDIERGDYRTHIIEQGL